MAGQLLEAILRVNWPLAFVCVSALYLFVTIWSYIADERRIRSLGGHASVLTSYWPLGVDFIWRGVQYAKRDEQIEFWDRIFKKSGTKINTAEANVGGRRIIFTAEPENIKAVLATQFNDFGKGQTFNQNWHEFLGNSIFSTDGDIWHNSRQLLRPQFIKDRVSDLEIFEHHMSVLFQRLPVEGQEVDLKDLFFCYTLDAATHFLLGRSVDSLQGRDSSFAHAFAEVQRIQNLLERSGPFRFLIPRKDFRRHLNTLNSFVEPYIEATLALSQDELEKRSKSDQGYTFLHALASYTRDRKVLRDQLVAVLLAGRDTTACTLSWLFYEISRQPAIVEKLRQEIKDVVGLNRAPTYKDLKSMKYLQNTLNETLRLYPVVPFNIRMSLKDTSLPRGGGVDGQSPVGVPAGTPLAYSALYMQLTSEIYPPTSATFSDPLTFDPSRWNSWQPKAWTYIPFNGGPRICVGQQFALTEMAYTVVRMLQRFSRVESRMPNSATGFAGSDEKIHSLPLPVTSPVEGETQPARAVRERDLKMKCEIVLLPAEAVRVALYRS